MATCGSIQHIFGSPLPENQFGSPLPENQSLIESLSPWKQIKPVKPFDHSFTEIFGELHFKENTPLSSLSSLVETLEDGKIQSSPVISYSVRSASDGFPPMNSGSLQMCTEGLGFESSHNIEDLTNDTKNKICSDFNRILSMGRACVGANSAARIGNCDQYRRSRSYGKTFPPPISCIGSAGKPWVWFKSYRQDGRFVLQEVRIPTQVYLHVSRENGRLRLSLVQPESDPTDQKAEEGNGYGEKYYEEMAEMEGNEKAEKNEDNEGKEADNIIRERLDEGNS